MDLMKRAHANPENRNVYLDPRRSDQVLALKKDGKWEVLSLFEASRLLLDHVSVCMKLEALSPKMEEELPMEARNALAIAGLLYNEEPEGYAKRAKGSMAAHLANCREKVIATETRVMEETLPVVAEKSRWPPPRLQIIELIKPDETAKPNLTPERAAGFLCAMPPQGIVDVEYVKMLTEKADTQTDYLIKKLWEAIEDGILQGDQAKQADEIIKKYDEDHAMYE